MNDQAMRMGTVMLKLQEWYQAQCNGDWEHSFGVKIDTLDNPGWVVSIDLKETSWEWTVNPLKRRENSDADWMQYEFADAKFTGAGGIGNLAEIVEAFFEVITAVAQ
jgi:hypothetical protein